MEDWKIWRWFGIACFVLAAILSVQIGILIWEIYVGGVIR